MKLVFLSILTLLLGLPYAESAQRCMAAKSCKSRKQCFNGEYWYCTSSRRGGEITEDERRRLENGRGRSDLADCAHRTCSESEIRDAYERARRGERNRFPGGGSTADDRLNEGRARSDREEAERRREEEERRRWGN